MTPLELRNSILNLAIQGKLTKQLDTDGFASEMIGTIPVANNVDGQRVKQKEVTEITEGDKAFDIPETWAWVKLGNVCTIARGGSPRPIKDYLTPADDGVNWIKIGDTEKNGKYISSTAEKIKPCGVAKSRMVHVGDFLLTNSMSFGRPYILKVDGCIHDGWLVISQLNKVFDQDYLYWLLSSSYAYSQFCGKVSGAVVKNLNSDKVANSVFPLPPLAEQHRIVAKIEELLPYIDRYEKAWSRLEEFNKRFPVDMQKSILQMAIQGKLVEQRPEEGTGEELYQQIQAEKQKLIKDGKIKKEKPLPEITEDEIPYDIPESWKLARVLDIAYLNSGNQYQENANGSLYVKVADMNLPDNQTEIKTSTRRASIPHKDLIPVNSIIFPKRGGAIATNKKRLVCQEPIGVDSNTMAMTLISAEMLPYVSKWFASIDLGQLATGTSVPQINNKDIYPLLIPIPPLAEQKRIVAKLEEILPLCERIQVTKMV